MCQAVILVQDVHAKLLQSCPTLWVYELWSARLLCPWGTLGNNAGVAIGCHALVLVQDQSVQFSSVTQSCPTLCDPMNRSTPSLPVHYQLPVYSNSCPSSRWCHPAISSSVIPFSSCPQSLPASGSFPMSQPFTLGGQSLGVSASASVLPMNTQDWSPLGWTGWISLQSKEFSRVFSNTIVQKPQLFFFSGTKFHPR